MIKSKTGGWLILLPTLIVSSCVPQAFVKSDYKSHLTKEEKTRLEAGEVVDKIHISYWRFKPSQIYWTGALRVEKDSSGNFKYTERGIWNCYYKSGMLTCTTVFADDGKSSYMRYYYKNGDIYLISYDSIKVINGNKFFQSTGVEFRNGSDHDTLTIRKYGYFEKDWKTILDERVAFDDSGKRKSVTKVK
ncbi:hypothetical protein [Hymenobacter sp. BT491]|uniref:hypothetical protein n=1 Tax=Hymenobacter sp. BT491 TaxID=2766779 RepID=UPI0016536C3B|nr:hypothetical protein [Hymenobacter sp. BT491]MBC6989153.1 hypothetical protein [Hymenobacter sp. BT491]